MRSRSNSPGLNFDNDRETFNFAERAHHQITASPAANSRVSKLLVRKVRDCHAVMFARRTSERANERNYTSPPPTTFLGFSCVGREHDSEDGGRERQTDGRTDRRTDGGTDAVEGSDSPKAEAATDGRREAAKSGSAEGQQDLASEQRRKMHAPARAHHCTRRTIISE